MSAETAPVWLAIVRADMTKTLTTTGAHGGIMSDYSAGWRHDDEQLVERTRPFEVHDDVTMVSLWQSEHRGESEYAPASRAFTEADDVYLVEHNEGGES